MFSLNSRIHFTDPILLPSTFPQSNEGVPKNTRVLSKFPVCLKNSFVFHLIKVKITLEAKQLL